jgi:hypothetical protein
VESVLGGGSEYVWLDDTGGISGRVSRSAGVDGVKYKGRWLSP